MTEPQSAAAKPRCAPCLAILLVGVVLAVALYGRVETVVKKVFSGAGMEHCCTIEGVPFNFVAVFVLLCGVAAALLIALFLQVRDLQLRRDFERKYGVKLPSSSPKPASSTDAGNGPSLHGYEHHDSD
jgi:hypothetical protein